MTICKLTIPFFSVLLVLGLITGHMVAVAFADPVAEATWKPTAARVIYTGDPDGQRYRVLPRVVRLLDGTLIAQMERGSHKRTPIFIRSTDGAKTWSKPYPGVMAKEIDVVSHMGVLLDGRLVAVSGGDVEMRLAYSSDQGKTWTAGNQIDHLPMSSAAAGEGRILQLNDGTLVIPLFGYLPEVPGGLSAGVVRSSDYGATWSLSVIGRANPEESKYFSETTVANLNDGTLVALMRPGLTRSVSTDGGKTWSVPVASGLGGTHCSLVQLADGVLLCGYHRPIQLALSADGGKSWYAKMLWSMEEPLSNWGWYTDVAMVDDNTAVALVKEFPASHIVRGCLLHRQPTAGSRLSPNEPWTRPGRRTGEQIVGPDGDTLVWVPAGKFMMGSKEGGSHELPIHEVQMDGFWIGQKEVTNAQYRAYRLSQGQIFRPDSTQGDNHPVVYVTWKDAVAYCEHYGLSLPTEAQWEYAARGPQSLRYPWGNEWDAKRRSANPTGQKCCWEDNRGPLHRTFPVGSFPLGVSWCGALDMAGNVWEWCADWYGKDYYKRSPSRNPQGPSKGDAHVLRGGSFASYDSGLGSYRSAYRYYRAPDDRLPISSDWGDRYRGFRVARSVKVHQSADQEGSGLKKEHKLKTRE